MKTKLFLTLTLLLATLVFTVVISAEDYTMWNLPEGAKTRLQKGRIQGMEYAPDGTRLIVASSIGTWFYDVQTGEELYLLRGHTNRVNSMVLSPDGNTLAVGSSDGHRPV